LTHAVRLNNQRTAGGSFLCREDSCDEQTFQDDDGIVGVGAVVLLQWSDELRFGAGDRVGHVRGARFLQRIVTTLTRLQPDIVFIAGDMYDGTFAKVQELAAPLARLARPIRLEAVAAPRRA
jgi:hypothetical protein